MKKLLVMVSLLLVTAMLVAACAPAAPAPAQTTAPAEPQTPAAPTTTADPAPGEVSNYDLGLIGVSLFSLEIPFPIATYEGARRAEADFNANVSIVDNLNDIAKNTSDIEDLMAAGMAALVIMPVDSQAVTPVVLDVMAAGIPVVAVNRWVADIPVDGVTHVWIGTDNVEAGFAKGEHFMTLIDEGTNVIILEGTPGAGSGIDRLAGFSDAVGGRINVLASQTANFNRVDGMSVAEDLLVAHPNAEVIIAMNDEMALGAIEAAFAMGRTPGVDILITGFDGTADARAAVAQGHMLFSVYQDPEGMGYKGIEVALGLLRGETFPPTIGFDIGFVE